MLDKKEIAHIAKLARLQINEAEVEQYSAQLSRALNYFEQISKVNTENVEPLITPTEIKPLWRQDEVEKEYTAEEMVSGAPQRTGNLFTVPPVV